MKYKISVFIIIISLIMGIGCISLGFSYPKNIVFHGFTIVGICVLLGVAVKTMDQLIDEIKVKSYRLWIVPLAIFIPTSMAYLALTEEPVIGMVLGTVIGILIAGKLDHPAYVISVILFITLVSIAFVLHIINIEVTTFYIIPVAAAGSFLDEFGHERWKSNKKSITFIFKHRFFLKTFAFFGVIIGFAQPIHFIGFLCFDIFYDLVDTASRYDAVRKKFVPSEFLTGVK
ncbi:MAG: hypothetical protein IMZ58_05605 [Thermoplasmata archaeon]|nr:hypothetical protein [Thermoplasmata archaeon]